MTKNGKSVKYVIAFALFMSLVSGSLVYGMTRPPDYASNSFNPGDHFYLMGTSVEYLGAEQEEDFLRIELYHDAWTAEVNGLSFTIRSIHQTAPQEVTPQMRYKGFYSIVVPLSRSTGWELVRLDVSNLDKSPEKAPNESNTKKIYVNERMTTKEDPLSRQPKDYAIRFYTNRIKKIGQSIVAQQEESAHLRSEIHDLMAANQTIEENISMLTESEKKHAENSKSGNLSKITSNENAIANLQKQIEENELRIELMEAEIVFLKTGVRPKVDRQLEDLEPESDATAPVKSESNTPEIESENAPETDAPSTENVSDSSTISNQNSSQNSTENTSETGSENSDNPAENTPASPLNPTVPSSPVTPPAAPPQSDADEVPEFEFLP